jgi:parallel beta-helix repeat protein
MYIWYVIWLVSSITSFAASPVPLRSISISSSDLPALIDTPGSYFTNGSLTYSAISNVPAITISCSNVSINFTNYALQQTSGVLSVTGIQIGSGLMNININNLLLSSFSQSGISIGSGSSFLIFDNVTFSACGNRCFEVVGTPASPSWQIILSRCTFINSCTQTSADNVITLSNCSDCKLTDCILSTNGTSAATGTICGVKLTNAARYYFSNVGISSSSGAADLRGFSLNNSSGGFFESCRVSSGRAFSATGTSRGVFLESGSGVTSSVNFFNNCIVAGLIGNTVDGYLSDTGCNGNMFTGCMSAANTAIGTSGVVHGYRSVNNTRVSFKNCEARGGAAATSTNAPYADYGFRLDTCVNNAVINCTANYNAGASGAVGIFAIQSTNCTFRENQATGNTQGFDFQGTFTQNTFIRNVADRNTNAAQYSGFPTTAVSDNIWSSSVEIITGPWTNVGIS